MYLYHYFEQEAGPFLSVTSLPMNQAKKVLRRIQKRNPNLVNPDIKWFLARRYEMEKTVRERFIQRGGQAPRTAPIYMTLGEHPPLATWFDQAAVVKIPLEAFNLKTVSFTYGDMFPVFNPKLDDGREYWAQVYFYDEILALIEKYGMPADEDYNVRDKKYPDGVPINQRLKYVEAQVWCDDALRKALEPKEGMLRRPLV